MLNRISIIIPTYNSSVGLNSTLSSIALQVDSSDIEKEVIVVDNNSTDNTKEIALQYEGKFEKLIYVNEKKQGSYAARNLGIKYASGDLICFLDADVEVESLFINKIVDSFCIGDVDYAGVNVSMKRSDRTLAADYDALTSFDVKRNLENGRYSPTLCLIIRPNVLKQVGNFDDRLESGGDVVFGKKTFEAGLKQVYLKHVEVTHPTRNSLKALLKKAKRVGRGYATHMYYYPHYFNHVEKFFKSYKFYLPNSPIKLYNRNIEKKYDIGFLRCVIVSFVSVALSVTYLNSYQEQKRILGIKN